MSNIIAVSWSDFDKYGCVNCGCDYVYSNISGGGSSPVTCGECKQGFVILADGLNKSNIGFGSEDGTTFYPLLQEHPRKGITKHTYVKPDIKPEDGGEYWSPRGVGYDLSGFVKCKAAGERIVQMVEKVIGKTPKTWLDYRPTEPDWIQVKFQSEDGLDLQKLCELCKDGIITEDKIKLALNVKYTDEKLKEYFEEFTETCLDLGHREVHTISFQDFKAIVNFFSK